MSVISGYTQAEIDQLSFNTHHSQQNNYHLYPRQCERDTRANPRIFSLPYPITPEETPTQWTPPRDLPPLPKYVDTSFFHNPYTPPPSSDFNKPAHSIPTTFSKARECTDELWRQHGTQYTRPNQPRNTTRYSNLEPSEYRSRVNPVLKNNFTDKDHQHITMNQRTSNPAKRHQPTNPLPIGAERARTHTKNPAQPQISSNDRTMLLSYLHQTIASAPREQPSASLPFFSANSVVEIQHPKPQTYPVIHPSMDRRRFNPRNYMGSAYLTCKGAATVWRWLGSDEVADREFRRYEARVGR